MNDEIKKYFKEIVSKEVKDQVTEYWKNIFKSEEQIVSNADTPITSAPEQPKAEEPKKTLNDLLKDPD